MKNSRPDHSSPQVYLASKRSSLNHDKLPQPYKIDWGPNYVQNVQSKTSSNKNFFQNMKEELTNIKTDFEKLIKKDNSFSSAGKYNKEDFMYTANGTSSGMKGKSLSYYKKDSTKKLFQDRSEEPDKLDIVMNEKELDANHRSKFYQMQKNYPSLSEKKMVGRAQQLKDKQFLSNNNSLLKPSIRQQFEQASTNRNEKPVDKVHQATNTLVFPERENSSKEKEIVQLKEKIEQLQQVLQDQKIQNERLQKELSKSNTEKGLYLSKMEELSDELRIKMQFVSTQEAKIKQLTQQLKQKDAKISSFNGSKEQIEKERAFLNDRINELAYHNDNFHNINMQLGDQNQHLKDNLRNCHNFIQQLKCINENSQNDWKRKLEFMKKDIEQYQKRQAMFSKEIEALNKELRDSQKVIPQQESQNKTQSAQVATRLAQIASLKEEIHQLKQKLQLQKEISKTLQQKYQTELANMNFQGFASSLQKSINDSIQQNANLKSKINSLEAQLDSLREQNRSYTKEINLYQQRQKQNKRNRQMSSTEWEELTQKIDKLTQQNLQLRQKIEYKALKQDVLHQQPYFESGQNESVIKMACTQLQEIQSLKQTLRDCKDENQFLREQLEQKGQSYMKLKKRNKQLIAQFGTQEKRHCCFSQEEEITEQKNRQIKALKELIFKVLIAKAGKKDNQMDSDFYFRKVEELRQKLSKLEE